MAVHDLISKFIFKRNSNGMHQSIFIPSIALITNAKLNNHDSCSSSCSLSVRESLCTRTIDKWRFLLSFNVHEAIVELVTLPPCRGVKDLRCWRIKDELYSVWHFMRRFEEYRELIFTSVRQSVDWMVVEWQKTKWESSTLKLND